MSIFLIFQFGEEGGKGFVGGGVAGGVLEEGGARGAMDCAPSNVPPLLTWI